MIKYTTGNIRESGAEALVNTVNCVGIMGKGLALQFKKWFPGNFKAYRKACELGKVKPGEMFIWESFGASNPRYIINFPTKRHWKNLSLMEDIDKGLVSLVAELKTRKISSVAVPPLGCGNGGLCWPEVKELIVAHLSSLDDITITIYEPTDD